MEIDERIRRKLKQLERDMDTLKPFLLQHLRTIEGALSSIAEQRKHEYAMLRLCDYDVLSLAQSTGISRSTFYNYDRLLQRYVVLSHDLDFKDDPIRIATDLREMVHMLREEKALMEKRDCRELQMKDEISRLNQQLADRDKTIDNLRQLLYKR